MAVDPDQKFFRDLVAFALEIREIPDHELPKFRKRLLKSLWRLEVGRDAMRGHPWVRCPARLFAHHWHKLETHEQKVYGALLGLVGFRTLTTYASLKTIANRAGLSPDRTSKALTSLKKRGFIKRWRQQHKQWRPYFTRLVPSACFPNKEAAEVLKQAVIA